VKGPPRNVPASVQARLLNVARERGDESQSVLIRYANERFLYRLGISPLAERFILKGAKVFELWVGDEHRPTRDLDFLGCGSPDPPGLVEAFRQVCTQPVPEDDGLVFVAESVQGTAAREDQEYSGASLKLRALLGKARIPLAIDVGFGDAVTPEAQIEELPSAG
jgi:hypothetical protein